MIKYQPWRALHGIANRLAWRFANSTAGAYKRDSHWLWRLNDWLASHYTGRLVSDMVARLNAEREKEEAADD